MDDWNSRRTLPSLECKSHGESTQMPLARVNREGKTWLSTLSSPSPVDFHIASPSPNVQALAATLISRVSSG